MPDMWKSQTVPMVTITCPIYVYSFTPNSTQSPSRQTSRNARKPRLFSLSVTLTNMLTKEAKGILELYFPKYVRNNHITIVYKCICKYVYS